MFVPLKNLNKNCFEKYGRLLEFDTALADDFQIHVLENEGVGWRIALMRVANQRTSKISCHPNTMEAFEPVRGVCAILVAPYDNPLAVEAFLLDRAVCVNKSTWHVVLSLSEYAIVKVTENADVHTETFDLGTECSVGLTWPNRGESLCPA